MAAAISVTDTKPADFIALGADDLAGDDDVPADLPKRAASTKGDAKPKKSFIAGKVKQYQRGDASDPSVCLPTNTFP